MFHIVTGGSASGKSAYAESLVLKEPGMHRYYIATMQPWDEECRKRIEKHRLMRREKQFETLEIYGRIQNLTLPEDSVVLLECLSNLVSNVFFLPEYAGQDLVPILTNDILDLQKRVKTLIMVTNEVFSDGIRYDPETARYQETLGRLNQELAKKADSVTEVVYGIPVKIR